MADEKPKSETVYPPVGFHFSVIFPADANQGDDKESNVDIRFQEVSGFSVEVTTEEIDEGGENRFTHRVPKKAKYGNLVLKRGMMVGTGLKTWLNNAIDEFIFKPVNLTVNLLDEEHNTLVSWDFVRAYPVKWSVSDLKAQDNSLVIETLELAYQYFTKTYHAKAPA